MSDEELRKTAKGNTYVPDVWVTHHDTDWGPHLWSANIVPWDEDYDAPITGWADNTHFVNADRIVAAEARIEALTAENAQLRDAVYIDDLTVTLQGKDRAAAIEGLGRALDLLRADMVDEAKASLRATLAEMKGEDRG